MGQEAVPTPPLWLTMTSGPSCLGQPTKWMSPTHFPLTQDQTRRPLLSELKPSLRSLLCVPPGLHVSQEPLDLFQGSYMKYIAAVGRRSGSHSPHQKPSQLCLVPTCPVFNPLNKGIWHEGTLGR